MTREEAIDTIKKIEQFDLLNVNSNCYQIYEKALDMAIEALKEPSIVRCKDCRYYNNDYMGEWCGRHQAPVWVKEKDFCSYGERREE